MRRVVITGMGIISSIGNDLNQVATALAEGKPGISLQPTYRDLGMRCHVVATIKGLDLAREIDKKRYRFMGDAAANGYLALEQAQLPESLVSHPRTGLVMGSGGGALPKTSSRRLIYCANGVFAGSAPIA